MPDQQSQHAFRIVTYGASLRDASPGHFSVELAQPGKSNMEIGLYPEKPHKAPIGGNGKANHEIDKGRGPGTPRRLESAWVPLHPDQAAKLEAFLSAAIDDGNDKYWLLGRNCESFVHEAAAAADLDINIYDVMTDRQLDQFNLALRTPAANVARDQGLMDFEGWHKPGKRISPSDDKPVAPPVSHTQHLPPGAAAVPGLMEVEGWHGMGGGDAAAAPGEMAQLLGDLPPGRERRVELLLDKPPGQWSFDEVRAVQQARPYWDGRHDRHQDAVAAVSAAYRQAFGDQPIRFDATGRLPPAEQKRPWPEQAAPGAAAQQWQQEFSLLGQWLDRMKAIDGGNAGVAAGRQTGPDGRPQPQQTGGGQPVDWLQRGLNQLLWPGRAAPNPAEAARHSYREGPVLVDGEFGPVTAAALDRAQALGALRPETEWGASLPDRAVPMSRLARLVLDAAIGDDHWHGEGQGEKLPHRPPEQEEREREAARPQPMPSPQPVGGQDTGLAGVMKKALWQLGETGGELLGRQLAGAEELALANARNQERRQRFAALARDYANHTAQQAMFAMPRGGRGVHVVPASPRSLQSMLLPRR